MEKVKIEMDLNDAITMLSKLKTRQKQNQKTIDLYASDGDMIPFWLKEDTENLDRIIDTVQRAVDAI